MSEATRRAGHRHAGYQERIVRKLAKGEPLVCEEVAWLTEGELGIARHDPDRQEPGEPCCSCVRVPIGRGDWPSWMTRQACDAPVLVATPEFRLRLCCSCGDRPESEIVAAVRAALAAPPRGLARELTRLSGTHPAT